jgi:hypothetical protein
MRMEGVVLAAGEGRRMRPLTERWAKPVLPIDGKPVITTLLDAIEEAGLGPVTVVVGYLATRSDGCSPGGRFGSPSSRRASGRPMPCGERSQRGRRPRS